jgi:hypothetical protein
MNTTTAVQNIVNVARKAKASEVEAGAEWYGVAHDAAKAMSDLETGAGVIAALSPMMGWERNVMLAYRAFEQGFADGCLKGNARKADAIMAGNAPLDILGGSKVRSFYANIVNPFGADVTIDRHAFDIVAGRYTTDKEKATLTRKGEYERHADAYREAGIILGGLTGAQVQAITWVTWRRIKGIK